MDWHGDDYQRPRWNRKEIALLLAWAILTAFLIRVGFMPSRADEAQQRAQFQAGIAPQWFPPVHKTPDWSEIWQRSGDREKSNKQI